MENYDYESTLDQKVSLWLVWITKPNYVSVKKK